HARAQEIVHGKEWLILSEKPGLGKGDQGEGLCLARCVSKSDGKRYCSQTRTRKPWRAWPRQYERRGSRRALPGRLDDPGDVETPTAWSRGSRDLCTETLEASW